MKTLLTSFLIVILFSIVLRSQDASSTLYLKDGSVINGIIIERENGKTLTVKTSDGIIHKLDLKNINQIKIDKIINNHFRTNSTNKKNLFSDKNLFFEDNKFKWEFSISGTFGFLSESAKSPSFESDGESMGYVTLVLRPGFFLTNSLEFEPEILMTSIEKTEPSFSLSGNLSYNFILPESNVRPFILAGYGIGNSVPIFNTLIGKTTDKLDVTNLNFGAGMKIFFSNAVAVRVEYRYQIYNYDDEFQQYNYPDGYTSSKIEYSINSHKILFGFSLFL